MKKLLLGPFKGLSKYFEPFNIDNNSFPKLFNAYAWRGRVKRKRGTSILDRLNRQIEMVNPPVNPWEYDPIVLVAGAGNLITGLSLESNSRIVPGSIELVLGANTYTEPATPDGTLVGAPAGSGTINYSSGAFTISGGGAGTVIGIFSYYPNLPVLGLEDFELNTVNSNYPVQIAFDTTYSYQINQAGGATSYYSTSYYKGSNNPVTWSNTDSNIFWTTNYQSAFWATNNKSGFHYVDGTYNAGTGTANITFTFTSSAVPFSTLVIGDKLWFNEWAAAGVTINGLVGTVSVLTNPAAGQYQVTFDAVQTVSGTGIAQLLTNSISGQDGIRWYDGDPTSGTGIPTGTDLGWVNFAPPLTETIVSINSQEEKKYYLVGALAIVPFKDRLLFFGPQIQAVNEQVIRKPLQDTVIWSWNGTPYYNSFVPTNATGTETFDVSAYYVDQTGKGGYLSAGLSMPIVTVNNNEDVLIVNFGGKGRKTRFNYSGNDLYPFIFYQINAELPSNSTFSSISLDAGVLDIGTYGIAITTQQSSERIDMELPDDVFQVRAANNGVDRVNSIRDFFKEWIYFSYPLNTSAWSYPVRTFMFNYRENSWGIFKENYTVQGYFRKQSKNTWFTISAKYGTWNNWRDPWNTGTSSPLIAQTCAGNPQGYVVIRDEGTGEASDGEVADITDNGLGFTRISSRNHCMELNDFVFFENCIGQIGLNGQIGKITTISSANAFDIDIVYPGGGYLGLGEFKRLSRPQINSKQFPGHWDEGKKTRIGVQQYLFDRTSDGEVTVQILLSTDPDDAWNSGGVVPDINVLNGAILYTQTVLTSPETNNLQMPTASQQNQIWHRMNTSLIGDVVQFGITLSDDQMRDYEIATSEISLHSVSMDLFAGPALA
jgi:hypothetical protein